MLHFHSRSIITLVIAVVTFSCAQQEKKENPETKKQDEFYDVNDFASVRKYDTHIHLEVEKTTMVPQAIKDNFHLLNINGDWGPIDVPDQQKIALKVEQEYPEQVAFAASFSAKNYNDPDFVSKTIAYLKNSFEKGAVGVKVWKNIGMELKDKDGKFVMIDNPRFDSIFDFIEKNNITLLSHQGEPKNCWLPIEKMTVNSDKNYFKEHPQYHMFLHPEYPSYEDQVNARDRMVAKHPNLRIVSVHLASLEWDVDEIAKRLDKFPNMSVDIAARIEHLEYAAQTSWQKIYDFCIKYQDRLLYGTDHVEQESNTQSMAATIHDKWVEDWKFLVTDDSLTNSDGMHYKGLHLPKEVVDKIYAKNAERMIPGIEKKYTAAK
ncbi:MAG: amidohydrolase family protein [Chitinophagaceae bacterium]|nr:amidohydrolase family protein [Chitinophagaceae bacterium]